MAYNKRWTRRHFSRIIINMKQLQSYNYSQSLTLVTVVEGLQYNSNLQDHSLASATVPPTESKQQIPLRDVIQPDDNPSTDYSIVTHRSQLQIIQPLIQFEYLSFGPSRSA